MITHSPLHWRRQIKNAIAHCFSLVSASIGIFFLAWILFTLFDKGLQGLNLDVFMQMTPPPGANGGLLNAIVGSILMTSVAIILGIPVGVTIALYLSEFGRNNLFSQFTRFINDVLLSAPSVILGLFVYEMYVTQVGHFSGWAGAIVLGLISIPIITRTSDSFLALVPSHMKEAAAALGAPHWKIILRVVLPVAKTGILTGVILATARISGETAPLLFTALNNQFWSVNMNKPLASLPIVIFQYAMSPYNDWHQLAWTGALILTLFVLSLNICVRLMFRQKIVLH